LASASGRVTPVLLFSDIIRIRQDFAENRLSPLHDERLLRSSFDLVVDSVFQDQVEALSGITAHPPVTE
jgi:hypothetical protein